MRGKVIPLRPGRSRTTKRSGVAVESADGVAHDLVAHDLVAHDLVACDLVIVGAGVAGLSAALAAAGRGVERILLVTKTPFGNGGNSLWAQGGVAAAVGEDDTPELHAADTVAVAGGLADAAAVAVLVREGRWRVLELQSHGAVFDRGPSGGLALGREAAHSRRRIVHAGGDATGREMLRALSAAVTAQPAVRVAAGWQAVDLMVREGRVFGLAALDATGRQVEVRAPAVVLATGGVGQLWQATTNPVEATGDGLALAARAGAELVDLEFVQFHPTALAVGDDPLPLLSEALRGEGAQLLAFAGGALADAAAGQRFMLAEHPAAELAPRDVVARAIARQLAAGARVLLDCRHLADFASHFPTIAASCARHGLDPAVDLLPVVPAAHYHMGGVAVDGQGATSLPGLWACGEVAASGVHGANRLASNSLLEALVWGARAGEDAARRVRQAAASSQSVLSALPLEVAPPAASEVDAGRPAAVSAPVDADIVTCLRHTMQHQVGVVRDAVGLADALATIDRLTTAANATGVMTLRLRNLLLLGRLIATAALRRPESRGAHFRADFPLLDPAWAWRQRLRLSGDGQIVSTAAPPTVGLTPPAPLRHRQ
jgi:L-aspartate oxidase